MFRNIVLVHGGLYEGMTSRRFWVDTGVVAALSQCGFRVLAPERIKHPSNWQEEATHLADQMASIGNAHIIAASNGCSAAARMAVDSPSRVRSLVFCWPATAGDTQVDALARSNMVKAGCSLSAVDALLAEEGLRGLTDAELIALTVSIAVIASDPPDLFHQQKTVEHLLATIPNASEPGSFPLPFGLRFSEALPSFCRAIGRFIDDRSSSDATLV